MIVDDMLRTPAAVRDAERWTAHNYHPLPVVIAEAEGAWVTDVDGRRYLDCLAGYSALNFGHRHPALIAAAHAQLDRLTLTSRAFLHDQFAEFCRELAELCGKDLVLPMNTGAEAVETAIKVARKWGYQVKGVPADQATIVVAGRQLPRPDDHDRQLLHRPGRARRLRAVHPGLPDRAVRRPGRAGRRDRRDHGGRAARADPGRAGRGRAAGGLPAPACARCAPTRNVLFIADEIQSGLGRTGETFACDHEGVVPDMYVLGKALGGGIVPVSAVAADADVLGVLRPGQHGSTFGGNPLACAVAHRGRPAAGDRRVPARGRPSSARGCTPGCARWSARACVAVRGRGLWAGVDIDPALMTGREACERLADARRAGQGHPRLDASASRRRW